MLGRNFPGCAPVPLIVGLDRVERTQDLVHRVEAEEPLAGGQELAEPCLLRNDRSAGREVADAAVAEPARARAHVLVPRNGELAARALDIVSIAAHVPRDLLSIGLIPPVSAE